MNIMDSKNKIPMGHSEYLRLKYLSNEKRKKKKHKLNDKIRIIDDNINLGDIPVTDYPELDQVKEELPVVVSIVDENPCNPRPGKTGKWKPIQSSSSQIQDIEKIDVKQEKVEDKEKLGSGLHTAKELRKEQQRLKEKEKKVFDSLNEKISGKYAKPVYRERETGKVRHLEKEKEEKEKRDKIKAEEKEKKREEFEKISMGLKQKAEQKEKLENFISESSKPFARYQDDEELDKLLREKEQDGDPMLEYFRKKKMNNQESKEGIKKYTGFIPINRFNIVPGHRWDGVDRSNGFEKRWFDRIAEKESIKEKAYRWATEDM